MARVPLSASSIRVVPAANQIVPGIGKYRYIAMLAEGGMADVYLAVTQSAGFEKLVVIKQLRGSLAEDPSFVAMFMDEARLAARLNHPNVVQTLEVGTDAPTGLHFIAMEFLEGVAHVRFARLKDRVPAPLAFHLRILIDVLRGLHYAHELRDFDGRPLNVVHRDVSPQNVMLTFAGGVKILDFGIAKAALAVEQRPEDFKGKLEYMAPEQARMEEVDRRADIFSVGVMLFEALTRRRLFRKGDDKLELLTTGRLANVNDLAEGIPKKLAAICSKAMAHDRNARYATADAMADELEDWLLSTVQHVTARDVGAWVAEKFAPTREKISAAIEAQLALIRAMPERNAALDAVPLGRLPWTELPHLTQPPVGYTIPPPGATIPPPGSIHPTHTIPPGVIPSGAPSHYPPGPGTARASSTPSANAWASAESTAAHPAFLGAPPTGPSAAPTKRLSGVLIALLTTVMTLLVVAAVLLVVRAKLPLQPSAITSGGAPAPSVVPSPGSAGSGEPEEAQIEYTIKASPPEATIYLDDRPLGANPATGKRARDGAMHNLRIEAPGFEPREESLAFDRSLFVTIDLRPSGHPAASASSSEEAPTAAPTSRGGRTPRGSPRSPRPRGPKAVPPDRP